MSYDLFFRCRSPDQSISLDKFAGYFHEREHYKVEDTQAWYLNNDTGVYFTFEYADRSEGDGDEGSVSDLAPVSFNLNYFRPHPFGLEAEPEVASFVRHFDLTVSDPQIHGMGDGQFSSEGFLRGWNCGNDFAYQAIVSQDPSMTFQTLPSSRIEACWRWNFFRRQRQREIGNGVFVPVVFFFVLGGRLRTGVTWPDAIPILLPTVDLILAPRAELAPKGWFGTKEDIVLFERGELDAVTANFPARSGELPAREVFYDTPPREIEQVFRNKKPINEKPTGVPFDQVLNEELLVEARSRAGGAKTL